MTTEHKIAKTLHKCGMPAGYMGYDITIAAVELCLEKPEYIHKTTTMLYPALAKVFNITAVRVERNIRHAIAVAFSRGDLDELEKMFYNVVDRDKGTPTNKEFIAMITECVRFEIEEEQP